eukprot:148084-Lingulodinium_polyedra.AAC.1
MSSVCRLRDELFPFGIKLVTDAGEDLVFKVLYCKLQPLELHLLPLVLAEPLEPERVHPAEADEEAFKSHFVHNFQYDPGMVVTWEALPAVTASNVWLLRHMVFRKERHVVSNAAYVPLEVVMAGRTSEPVEEEEEEVQEGAPKRAKISGAMEEALENRPALQRLLNEKARLAEHEPASGSAEGAHLEATGGESFAEMDEAAVLEEVFKPMEVDMVGAAA